MSSRLPPGIYRLTADVKNPDADLRFRRGDWRKRHVSAGTLFTIEEDKRVFAHVKDLLLDEETIKRMTFYAMFPSEGGMSSVYTIGQNEELYKLIEAKLEPANETPETLLTRLGFSQKYDSWGFLCFLAERMGNEWLEIQYKDFMHTYTEDDQE